MLGALGLGPGPRRRRRRLGAALLAAGLWCLAACGPEGEPAPAAAPAVRPSILLVTLDTTRADVMGYESGGPQTPALDALAARGVRFSRAQAPAPMTLPAHASMMTGKYPAEHGIHENARYLAGGQELLAERLRAAGYDTAAFVSAVPLSRQFGLARGFGIYDEAFGRDEQGKPRGERRADATTDAARAYLARRNAGPLFLWVHYFDPHEPYDPPEPYASRFPSDPYRGEVAFMDGQVGRLVEAFEERVGEGPWRAVVVGDHGEALGDHGEALHGNLLYQGVMRVPLLIAGSGIAPGLRTQPVSTRRIFDTVLAAAGLEAEADLLEERAEVVLGEAMKPFLQYGWQPQIMAVEGRFKAIRAGGLEVYDLDADPREAQNLAPTAELSRTLRQALRGYPVVPGGEGAGGGGRLSREDRERLASLGYAGGEGRAPVRPDAPAPRDMVHLFSALDRGSALFVQQRYQEAVRTFAAIESQDPKNLMVKLRLAVGYSSLGHSELALKYFEAARKLDPASVDVRHYLAMHYFRDGDWASAGPLFESVLTGSPGRIPALEGLAQIREREGDLARAIELQERIIAAKAEPSKNLTKLAELRMGQGDTPAAILAFERARGLEGEAFTHFLELGVCYLADRRLEEARGALDRVPADHPGYAMALFKRAQVSVLLREPDRAERVRRALEGADEMTRELIRNEALFRDIPP